MATPILRYSPSGPALRTVTPPPSVTTFTTEEAEEESVNPANPTPILEYHPSGGAAVPPWPPAPTDLTYPECGTIQLVSGQSWIDVTFADEKPDANWIFEELQVVNTTDPTPLNIWPGIVTVKTVTGFTLQLNGLPNTDNYFLHWAVGGCATSDWVVSPGITATNFLQLTDTPDDYTEQAGMGVKVNATEDGLEFGVVASTGGGIEGPVFNVQDYGAVADCQTLFDITMPIGAVVTSVAYTFTEADVGKWVVIRGATAGGISPLVGTIISVSGHSATLDTATTTVLTVEPTSFPRMDFGTDNTVAFVLACLAVPGPGNRNFYDSIPFTAAGVMNPVLAGDGGVVYIPRGNYFLKQVSAFPFWFFETNNIHIKGDGIGATVLFYDSNQIGGILGGGFAGHGLFQNVTLSDMTFWDLNFYTGGGNAVNMWRIDNLRIERIETVNSKGNAAINYQGYATAGAPINNRLYIRDCWVHGNEEDGSVALGYSGIEGDGMNVGEVFDVHIEHNRIEGPSRHGYEGGGNCQEQYFIGNTVDMKDGGLSGINPTGGSTTVVMGNTIKNVGAQFGIDFTVDVGPYMANDIRCIGNSIQGSTINPMAAGFRFQNTSGDVSVAHLNRIIVANNWVESNNAATSGILLGEPSPSILIEGNWFNVLYYGVDGGPFVAAAGKYIVIKNNYFSCPPLLQIQNGNLIIENNVVPPDLAVYGGSPNTCNIDSQTVAAGAIYSNLSSIIQGARTTDSVEIVRGVTTAPSLIIWGVVTAAEYVTTYAYNPTGSSLGTGAATKCIVHRPVRP